MYKIHCIKVNSLYLISLTVLNKNVFLSITKQSQRTEIPCKPREIPPAPRPVSTKLIMQLENDLQFKRVAL